MEFRRPTIHRMTRRCNDHDYSAPGLYHITMHVAEELGMPFGQVVGDPAAVDGTADAPHVHLSATGQMVEHELMHSIGSHYKMIEVQDHIVMPEHIHAILEVHAPIIAPSGKPATLGQVIAGFKKGCNKRYWEIISQEGEALRENRSGTNQSKQPAHITATSDPAGAAMGSAGSDPAGAAMGSAGSDPASAAMGSAGSDPAGAAMGSAGSRTASAAMGSAGSDPAGAAMGSAGSRTASAAMGSAESRTASAAMGSDAAMPSGIVGAPAVFPQSPAPIKVPSSATSGRQPLFAPGYCDVMPLHSGQLATQRAYIKDNPRSRLLRTSNRAWLMPRRGGINTALTPSALRGYLQRECPPSQATPEALADIEARLLIADNPSRRLIDCDSYGNRALLTEHRCLPVVCHRKDTPRFAEQKARCLEAAAKGAVLISPRIAKGEQAIMDALMHDGFPVVLICDNGFPDRYHPSADRLALCTAGRLLLITPWQYRYCPKEEPITVPVCKAMNCLAQALCRTKDNWWKTLKP